MDNQQPSITKAYRYVGTYKVSECGCVVRPQGNVLNPRDNGRGYLIVSITLNGKRVCKGVHRLVAEAWIPNPNGLPEVNHKDSNRRNNSASNLEWCTHGENIAHSYASSNRSATGVNNARCLTDEEEVIAICGRLQSGQSSAHIRDAGFDYNLIRAIKSRRNWKHISDKYKW